MTNRVQDVRTFNWSKKIIRMHINQREKRRTCTQHGATCMYIFMNI